VAGGAARMRPLHLVVVIAAAALFRHGTSSPPSIQMQIRAQLRQGRTGARGNGDRSKIRDDFPSPKTMLMLHVSGRFDHSNAD